MQTVDAGRRGLVKLEVGKALKAWYMRQRGKVGYNKLFPSDRRVLLTHWVGEAVAKVDSDKLYRRRLFERIGVAMTADCTDDNLINLEDLDGSYTLMNAGDGREPRDDVQPFSHADEEHLWVTSDVDDEDESEGDYTWSKRVRESHEVAICLTPMTMTSTLVKQHCRWNSHRVVHFPA